jgi:osmotically-inducible protein OsmY
MRTALAVFCSFFFLTAFAAQAAGPTDVELTKRVKGALGASLGTPAREIEIIVLDRVVSLHGRVPSQSVREAAASAAERTPGVRSVANNLSVSAGH